jgi:hypothetical protein
MSDEFIDTVPTNSGGTPAAPEIDSIWLTKTSVKPIWLAGFIGLALIGLFAFWPLLIIATVVVIGISLAWLSESREESDELPLS